MATELNNDLIPSNIAEKSDAFKFCQTAGTSSYGRGAIDDALHVSLTQWDADANKVGYVYSGYTSSLPGDCNHGVREVIYYNSTSVMVRITGRDLKGNVQEWLNEYNGATWTGWRALSNQPVSINQPVCIGAIIIGSEYKKLYRLIYSDTTQRANGSETYVNIGTNKQIVNISPFIFKSIGGTNTWYLNNGGDSWARATYYNGSGNLVIKYSGSTSYGVNFTVEYYE